MSDNMTNKIQSVTLLPNVSCNSNLSHLKLLELQLIITL